MRYVENGDGTVTDGKTGLMWKKKPEPVPMTWNEATSATWPEFAGHSDWRVPTIEELLTLVNYSRSNPASEFPDMPASDFWSGSSYAPNPTYAWYVFFYNGYSYANFKTTGLHVRLVRGGQSFDSLRAEIAALREGLEIIAGRRQCANGLMSNVDVAIAALDAAKERKP